MSDIIIPEDAPVMSDALKALLEEAAGAEAAATAAAVTPEESAIAAALARREAAKDALAIAERTRRRIDMAAREKVARAASKDSRALYAGLDLVDLFPVGNSPDPAKMPGKGVLILRSPTAERCKAFQSDVEQKIKLLADASADLACDCVVDPDLTTGGEGIRLRGFLDAYPNVAVAVGSKALVLGGSRSAADKRGHG